MPNMLIADDNRQIVSILEEYAKKEGYSVVVAYDGAEAMKKALSVPFDIILLDVMMPLIDGFEVCREIRRYSTVPVIMITARGEDFERIMGLDNGADDYIVKPFSPGEVMARVRAIMRRITREGGVSAQVFSF
ncbi:response regulator, partial [Ruminococcaceae bacterium OttesenSCG-928-A11]|nr:response regulator [Ruminococcaceae bacterium OttesenSCG-928-A11]